MRAWVLVAALLVSVGASGCYSYEQVPTPQPKYSWVPAHYYWDSPTQKWLWRDGYYAALPPAATYVDAPAAVSYSVGLSYGYPWYGWGPYYGYGYGYGYPGYYGHAHYGHGSYGHPGHYGTPHPSVAPRQPVIHVHPPSRRR